jgi:ABC-type nitrate/sulfonate/bicarbonate transport system substrate-binding protein
MRKWAQEHSDLLVRFIAANVEAQRWLMDPGNKDKAIALFTSDRQPPEIATATYERQMHGLNGWTKDAQFDVEGFKNVLEIRAEVEGSWGGKSPAPEKFYDASYYEKAMKIVDRKK